MTYKVGSGFGHKDDHANGHPKVDDGRTNGHANGHAAAHAAGERTMQRVSIKLEKASKAANLAFRDLEFGAWPATARLAQPRAKPRPRPPSRLAPRPAEGGSPSALRARGGPQGRGSRARRRGWSRSAQRRA